MMNERRLLPPDGKYCMYLRKSRDEAKQERMYGGDVLAKHRMMLEYAADMNGHAIRHEFREVVSGETIAARPEMRQLVEDVASGKWHGVYVMAVDRLSRGSQQDQGIICDLLEITGAFLVTPSGYFDPRNSQDMDTIRYQLFNSNNEFRSYNRRMHDSLVASVMSGQYIGTYPPYGYDKVQLQNGFKTLRPNDKAQYVRMMYDWAGNQGMSLYAIAKRLTDMGVTPPNGEEGAEWVPSSVGNVLSNVAYMGISARGRRKTQHTFSTDAMERKKVLRKTDDYVSAKGEWEPLVSEELFERVKAERARRLPVRHGCETNIFAGVLRCAKCGMALQTDLTKGHYQLRHKRRRDCHTKGASERVVLEELVAALKERIDDFEVAMTDDGTAAEHERNVQAVDNLQKLIAKLDDRAKGLLTMRADGEITATEYAEARQQIAADRESACDRLEAARQAIESEVDYGEEVATMHQAIDLLLDDSVPRPVKNEFLRTIIDHIDYWNDSEPFHNDRLQLTVYFRHL